jgi:hypothetical protein
MSSSVHSPTQPVFPVNGKLPIADNGHVTAAKTAKQKEAVPPTQKRRSLRSDRLLHMVVVVYLGLVLLMVVGGAIFLSYFKLQTPEILATVGAASIGAIAGLLAPSPLSK